MGVCEVIEIRNSADAVGYSCPGAASKECSDCGIQVCEDHAEPCGTCFSIFCPPCRFLIERSTRSPRTGNVESEKGLRTPDKTSMREFGEARLKHSRLWSILTLMPSIPS